MTKDEKIASLEKEIERLNGVIEGLRMAIRSIQQYPVMPLPQFKPIQPDSGGWKPYCGDDLVQYC